MLRPTLILSIGLWIAASSFAQDGGGVTPPAVLLKIVKGAPFSAHVVTETTQVLADGNHVVHRSTALIARDSEGRTRREQTQSNGAVTVAFIHDPVAGFAYVLEPLSHMARKLPAELDVKHVDVAITKTHTTGPDAKSEALGLQILEGVLAEGTRISRTIAAGEAGNERPMEITSEAWYSDELQTLIVSRTLDPRVGEITYKLSDIRRGEPDRSLFEVSPDYTMTEKLSRPLQSPVEKLKNE